MLNKIEKMNFGKTVGGEEVTLYTLSNSSGMKVGIMDYGCTVAFVKVPSKKGILDVALGYDKLEDYEREDGYLGAVVGRCANRIANGKFTLNGVGYSLYCNDGKNHLHGGKIGFDKKVWSVKEDNGKLVFSAFSPDGEEGYPGNLTVTVTYSLDEDNTLCLNYTAESDRDTVCNLTNHTYFNLAGHNSGAVLNQYLQLFADSYTKTAGLIPTGELVPVEGTPMDFRKPKQIGKQIEEDYEPLKDAGGYDHNFALRQNGTMHKASYAYDETSGVCMTCSTTMPGIQLYTGNFLSNKKGKNGAVYHQRNAFCLETQYFPDAINHPDFEQPVLKKGQTYHHCTTYQFGILD